MANPSTGTTDFKQGTSTNVEEEDFASLLEESFKGRGDGKGALKENEIVKGTVVQVTKDYAVVDIGYKSEGQVPIQEFGLVEGKPNGEKYKFKVIKFNKKRGNIVLSRRVLLEKEREELKKDTLQRLKEGAVLTGIVKNLTDYGAFIDLGGIDGLLHITDMSWGRV